MYKNYVHIGVAVGTDKGLVVAGGARCDQMTIAESRPRSAALAWPRGTGKLPMANMQGGTFTISNGGV